MSVPKYEYRLLHIFVLIFAVCMVGLGLFVDFNPTWYMSMREKILIYCTPMVFLFLDMRLTICTLETKAEKRNIQHRTMIRIFAIYVIALATLLFLGSTFRLGFYDRNIWKSKPFTADHFKMYCNLKPFKSVNMYMNAFRTQTMSLRIIILNVVGNLIAFAPFGFFLPVVFGSRIRNVGRFLLVTAGTSALCELIQFVTMVGQADVDDVILNVLGALVVYVLVHIPPVRRGIRKLLPYGDF